MPALQDALNNLKTFLNLLVAFSHMNEFERVGWRREQYSDVLYEAALLVAAVADGANIIPFKISMFLYNLSDDTLVQFLQTVETALKERNDPRVDTPAPYYTIKYSRILREVLR